MDDTIPTSDAPAGFLPVIMPVLVDGEIYEVNYELPIIPGVPGGCSPPAKTWERVAPPRRAVAARKEEGHEGEEGHGRLFFSFV